MKIVKIESNNMANKDILENIFSFHMGKTPTKDSDNYDGDIKWVTIKDMKSKFITETDKKIKKGLVKISPAGSLIGSFKMTVGRFSFLTEDSCTNEAIITIEKEKCKINLNYLYYLLPEYFKKNSQKNGQGLPLLNSKMIKNIEIRFHNKDQQEKISFVLSVQEKQIETLKSLIKKLEKRNSYYAEKLLSGELRVRENSETGKLEFYENEDWQDVVLNGVGNKIPTTSKILTIREKYKDIFSKGKAGLDNYLEIGDIDLSDKSYNLSSKTKKSVSNCKIVPKGTLLISTVRPTRGCATITKSETVVSGAFARYFLGEDNYPLYIINTRRFKSYCLKNMEGGTYPTIKSKIIDQYEIVIHEDHNLITSVLNNLNEELENLKQLLPKEEKRFQWMLDNLLSGEYEIVD